MSNQPWDRLYTTRKWRNLRARHLAKNRLCVMCMEKGRPTLATICDHIEPHKVTVQAAPRRDQAEPREGWRRATAQGNHRPRRLARMTGGESENRGTV